MEDFYQSHRYHGQCLEKLLTLYSAGSKLDLGQEIGITGGLFHHVFGVQFGNKGMVDVLRIVVVIYRMLSSIVYCYSVFGVQRILLMILQQF